MRLAARAKLTPPRSLLDEHMAALRLGISVKTIQYWRSIPDKGPPYVRLESRTIRYDPDALEAWLQARTVGAGAVA